MREYVHFSQIFHLKMNRNRVVRPQKPPKVSKLIERRLINYHPVAHLSQNCPLIGHGPIHSISWTRKFTSIAMLQNRLRFQTSPPRTVRSPCKMSFSIRPTSSLIHHITTTVIVSNSPATNH